MFIEFTEEEFALIFMGLNDSIKNHFYTLHDLMEGDEAGIKNNLEVQNIAYCGLKNCVDIVRIAQKIEDLCQESHSPYNTTKYIAEWRDEIEHINREIKIIQDGKKARKAKRD